MRHDFPHWAKIVTVWLVVATALFLGIQAWLNERDAARFRVEGGGHIEIRRGPDGHYHWPGSINGRAVDFLVDTGATSTAIPAALARELGLRAIGEVQSQTAGGAVRGRVVRADIALQGGVQAERLPVVALDGLGERPLLGMDLLGRLQWRQSGGVLRIEPAAP